MELIIPTPKWKKSFGKNPRNTVAGWLNRTNPDYDPDIVEMVRHNNGFLEKTYVFDGDYSLLETTLLSQYNEWSAYYPIDGIMIKPLSEKRRLTVGHNGTYYHWSIAWKPPIQTAKTKVIDIERLVKAGHAIGAVVIVDNTFATPINQNPLQLGADLVLHSATKFLGGHADALGGVACGKKDLIDQIYHYREINGATLHPMAAYLILRGMKTLELRIQRQNESALKIAQYLESHPAIERVYYPGLRSHEGYQIARQQMRGFGGMLSFMLKENKFDAVRRFLPRLRFAHAAANLGAVETIVGPPATTSHVECTKEERAKLGIPEGLIRYSAGIENVEDLISDLKHALDVFV